MTLTEALPLQPMLDGSEYTPVWVASCRTCAALVQEGYEEAHEAWHAEQEGSKG